MEQPPSFRPVHFFGQDPSVSAEEFLLQNRRPGLAKRALARLGFRIHLGKFKPNGMSDYTSYFFAWCRSHKKYYVGYEYSYSQEIRCSDCEAEWERTKPTTENIKQILDDVDEEFRRICRTEDLF